MQNSKPGNLSAIQEDQSPHSGKFARTIKLCMYFFYEEKVSEMLMPLVP
jgi:hypothetical protein